jgi:hypothetical protein
VRFKELLVPEDRMGFEKVYGPHNLLLCAFIATNSSDFCAKWQVENPKAPDL